MAGTVVKIGPGVEGFSVDDQVFAMADNTYAELCVVKADVLAKVPKGIDLIRAAAVPLVPNPAPVPVATAPTAAPPAPAAAPPRSASGIQF